MIRLMKFSQKVKAELDKMRIVGKELKEIFSYGVSYGLKSDGEAESLIIDRVLGGNVEIGGIFMRGVFKSCGSISDPNKDYHLELALPNREKCIEVLDFFSESGISLKLSERNGLAFIYCKECEKIADFLTYIGATKLSMELMNVIIHKGIRNDVNRAVNCVSANIERTIRAAERQINDIEYVFSVETEQKKEFLSKELREVAVVRQKNIGMSLGEIGEALNIPISKSGVNHRLKKISEISAGLRK